MIVAKVDCRRNPSVWKGEVYQVCVQYLSIVDTNTGEIIVSVKDTVEGDNVSVLAQGSLPIPSWENIVLKLGDKYPQVFENHEYHQRLKDYQSESEKRALAQVKEN